MKLTLRLRTVFARIKVRLIDEEIADLHDDLLQAEDARAIKVLEAYADQMFKSRLATQRHLIQQGVEFNDTAAGIPEMVVVAVALASLGLFVLGVLMS